MEPTGKDLIKDISRRMHRIMNLLPAQKGSTIITEEVYSQLDDKDFTILWFMPVKIITTKILLSDMRKRANILGLMDARKTIVRSDKIQAN
jgi:ethanolamine utilization cobalamin adenosyltransferase